MKNVLITGAAGGVGRALVAGFSAAGYRVLATDRVEQPADLACGAYLACDLQRTVEEPAYADAAFARVRELLGREPLAALVNNAAVQVLGPAGTLTREDWRRTLDVNLLAPFLWAQALLPELEAARGMVLNISSIHARLTKPGFVAYATSKAALSGMTRAMAVELGRRIRVNAIEPAAIDTPMLRAGFAGREDKLDALRMHHPCGAIAAPEELASLAVGMAESTSLFRNGAIVGFDGGIGSRLHDPEDS